MSAPSVNKVLVVEDQQVYRSIYGIYFSKSRQYDVKMAFNGQEALDVLAGWGEPSVIFLDLNMPVMDGEEFLRKMSARTKLRVPIVVVSTESENDRAQQAIADGARVYLRKPFRFEDLDRILQSCLPAA